LVSVAKVTRSLIAGLIAGALGWAFFMFLYILYPTQDPNATGLRDPGFERLFAAVFGALLGLALGLVEGINTGSHKQLQRALAAYAIAGLIGGFVGLLLGQMVMGLFSHMGGGSISFIAFFMALIARTLAWGMWGIVTGVLLGIALGFVSGSMLRLRLAAVGGAIGGLLGGFVFQLLNGIPFNSYPIQTLVAFSCVAAGVAFFQALAQELFKQAWVKVMVGKGEGREFQIAKPTTVIGKDELADIPLFGDPQIARRHVIIQQQNGRHTAVAGEAGLAFAVNGQSVSSAGLKHGDLIQIASRQLQFNERGGRATKPLTGQTASAAPQGPPVNVPIGACPYCGVVKDAAGRCGCSVGAPEPIASAGQATQAFPAGTAPYPTGQTGTNLQVTAGPLVGQAFYLTEGQSILIGRAPEAQVSVPSDTFISRRHALISLRGGVPIIQDQGSSNGTLVNGQRVVEQSLRPGDIIQMGETQIRVG